MNQLKDLVRSGEKSELDLMVQQMLEREREEREALIAKYVESDGWGEWNF